MGSAADDDAAGIISATPAGVTAATAGVRVTTTEDDAAQWSAHAGPSAAARPPSTSAPGVSAASTAAWIAASAAAAIGHGVWSDQRAQHGVGARECSEHTGLIALALGRVVGHDHDSSPRFPSSIALE